MKNTLLTILVFISIDLYSQIENRNYWPKYAQKDFELIQEENVDTFLVYFENYVPWNSLPDSCNDIPYVLFLWANNGKYFAKKVFCDSITRNAIPITSTPISFFLNHKGDFLQREKYFSENKTVSLTPTDDFCEYIVFLTLSDQLSFNVSTYERTHKDWNQQKWINATIITIDLIKKEVNKNVR